MSPAAPIIVLSGVAAATPGQGGATWAVLQYVLGLEELGCKVFLIEPFSGAKLTAKGEDIRDSKAARYFRAVVERFGIADRSALLDESTGETVGLTYEEILEAAQSSDLLINIAGLLKGEQLLNLIPRRLYLDLDPGFVQLWHTQGVDVGLSRHTHFATIGLAIGEPGCAIPTCGIDWIKTLQPIVLSHWPVAKQEISKGLTTIGNWRAYGSIEHEGVFYGQKVHSLRQLRNLPRQLTVPVTVAMSVYSEEQSEARTLMECGWQFVDPRLAGTPDDYQHFVQNSWAEIGVAKSGYVAARCGWFSDRSVAYLASGRPVIAQDTGFDQYLPCGDGLFSFRTDNDVVLGIEQLERDYAGCRHRARAIAEDYFNSRKVLPALLQQVEVPL